MDEFDRVNQEFAERQLFRTKAQEMGVAFVDIDRIQIARYALDSIAADTAYKHTIIPVKRQDDILYVAMADPTVLGAIDDAHRDSGCRIVPTLAIPEAIERGLHRYYPPKSKDS